MSHGIIQPIDQIFSTVNAEWHGLAQVVPAIDRSVANPLLFPIISAQLSANVGGSNVALANHKALIADFRGIRPELASDACGGLVSLHVPKRSYEVITNEQLWLAMERALKDIGATVTCVGTLEAARKFFISVALGDGSNEFSVNGDKFLANLNFVTSHDGTLGIRTYDSMVRIVCMNTLRASLAAQGKTQFTVYHTKGANLALVHMGELVNEILAGRVAFRNQMEYLASVAITPDDARFMSLGYFVRHTKKTELSTRAINAAESIALLFSRGQGNNGANLYDLLNGATEYWTNGDGTGKGKDSPAEAKAHKANFGEAAEHKNAFQNALMAKDAVKMLREAGEKAQTEIDRKAREAASAQP